jgi:HSP90 family molecular chaperone
MQLRNPKEVTKEDYNEFYKKTFNEYLEPLASSHFTTEVVFFAPQVQSLCVMILIYTLIHLEDVA